MNCCQLSLKGGHCDCLLARPQARPQKAYVATMNCATLATRKPHVAVTSPTTSANRFSARATQLTIPDAPTRKHRLSTDSPSVRTCHELLSCIRYASMPRSFSLTYMILFTMVALILSHLLVNAPAQPSSPEVGAFFLHDNASAPGPDFPTCALSHKTWPPKAYVAATNCHQLSPQGDH